MNKPFLSALLFDGRLEDHPLPQSNISAENSSSGVLVAFGRANLPTAQCSCEKWTLTGDRQTPNPSHEPVEGEKNKSCRKWRQEHGAALSQMGVIEFDRFAWQDTHSCGATRNLAGPDQPDRWPSMVADHSHAYQGRLGPANQLMSPAGN